ncbi:PepSY-associated TM helix domain-containing protein [Asticcacaulis sp. 201]|uniref:PepSY-associated TM helix domain-containing protein n=1 Tax=Asticcacaulis sp. 201 TaxID=3028787 RepID=UPI002915CED3|nr:PepSY-associated TM helix domain-containing protein [Asticcacaulis sp. 201]MDV6331191.1 PepSY-associated TM helix domain-containing protein [Asticcacaulis sp. 201]
MASPSALKPWRMYVRQIHWITAAFSVTCLCLYALTGFFLNNEGLLATAPVTTRVERPLSSALAAELGGVTDGAILSAQATDDIGHLFGMDARGAKVRVSGAKVTINLPDPGKRTTISVDPAKSRLVLDRSDRGAIAFLTDLHKGKNVRPAWRYFIDVFAISVLLFSISGFILLVIQARMRKMTWPLVALGVVVPIAFLILILHL